MSINSEVSLDALAHRIRDEHAQAEASARDALEHAIAAGQLLIQAKAVVGHGGWLPWLEKNCPFSRRTAQAYTLLARKASTLLQGDAQRVAHLSVRSALALLAESKGTGADKFQPGQKRAAAEKPIHLKDQQLSPAVAMPLSRSEQRMAPSLSSPGKGPSWTATSMKFVASLRKPFTRSSWQVTSWAAPRLRLGRCPSNFFVRRR